MSLFKDKESLNLSLNKLVSYLQNNVDKRVLKALINKPSRGTKQLEKAIASFPEISEVWLFLNTPSRCNLRNMVWFMMDFEVVEPTERSMMALIEPSASWENFDAPAVKPDIDELFGKITNPCSEILLSGHVHEVCITGEITMSTSMASQAIDPSRMEVERPVLVGGVNILTAKESTLVHIVRLLNERLEADKDMAKVSEVFKAKAAELRKTIKLVVKQIDTNANVPSVS